MTASSNSPEPDDATESMRSASVDGTRSTAGIRRGGVLSTHDSKEAKAVRALGHEWVGDENPYYRRAESSTSPSVGRRPR